MDMDSLEDLTAVARPTRWLGHNYHYLTEVGSTNDVLKMMVAEAEPPTGTVVLTDYQSKGRGRLQRSWQAPPKSSLLQSVLFRPPWPVAQAQWITMLASVAAVNALQGVTAARVALKWPNDVVIEVEGVWHKVSGLLVESEIGAQNQLAHVILGIGINVNIEKDALPKAHTPATSLLAVNGEQVARLPLLLAFWQRLEQLYDQAVLGQSPQVAWQERLITVGQSVRVTYRDGGLQLVGVAEGTNEHGHLLVRDEMGVLHAVAAGDVTLRS